MAWTIKFTEFAEKQMKKLDKVISKKIFKYLRGHVLNQSDPRAFGKPLLHDKTGLWRYRVENYRVICKIEDQDLVVLVLRVEHRKDVYDD